MSCPPWVVRRKYASSQGRQPPAVEPSWGVHHSSWVSRYPDGTLRLTGPLRQSEDPKLFRGLINALWAKERAPP